MVSPERPQFSDRALEQRVAKADVGTRNRTLYGAAKDAARQGTLTPELEGRLRAAADAAGLDHGEIGKAIRSGARGAGIADSGHHTGSGGPNGEETPSWDRVFGVGEYAPKADPQQGQNAATPPDETDPEADEFFSARPILDDIRTYARARRVSPWSVFGVAAVDAIAAVPPSVVLPALVGGHASLNLYVALVGPSGAGKDSSESAAREGFSFDGRTVPVVPLGSGEGIARTYRPSSSKDDDTANVVTSAVFSVSEIDTWTALSNRTGSTITAELRKMYTGQTIGFANANKDTRNVVAAHSYRACLIAGVQPLRSGPLLSAADGGLPQRFVWLPTLDPDAPAEPPEAPELDVIDTPDWNTPDGSTFSGRYVVVGVPDDACAEIDAHRLAVLRGDPDVDPLDGHALLTRLKVAAALMALEVRTEITSEDWRLAGLVMAVSRQTRDHCQRALVEQVSKQSRARAMDAADREEILSDRRAQRARDGILRQLRRRSPQPRSHLYRNLKGDIRDYFDAAVGELVELGTITEADAGPDGRGRCISLTQRDR